MEITEALAKAHETLNTPDPEPVAAPEAPAAEATTPTTDAPPPAASARARNDQGRFTTKPAEEKPAAEKVAAAPKANANGAATSAPPAPEAEPGAAASPSVAPGEAVAEKPEEPALKPPQSWRADEREEFAKAPRKVQEAALRREKEITAKLNEVAQTTRAAQEFQQVAAPWEPMFRAQGMSSTQAFDAMARTYYTLQTAPANQKAQVFAQLIRQSGLGDEQGINLLAAALDGKPMQGASVAADPVAIARQVEQNIQARLQQQAAQFAGQRNQARIEAFAEKHQFFNDVREKMADVLSARGQSNPTDEQLEDAYNIACLATDHVSAVIRQREASKAAQSAQASTAATQAAASSVRSTPAAPPVRTAQPKTTKDAISMAREQLGMK